MQNRAPNSITSPVREIRLHLCVVIKETNAAKWRSLLGAYTDAELAKCRQAIRHDALAARFVDGRVRAVNPRRQSTGNPGTLCCARDAARRCREPGTRHRRTFTCGLPSATRSAACCFPSRTSPDLRGLALRRSAPDLHPRVIF